MHLCCGVCVCVCVCVDVDVYVVVWRNGARWCVCVCVCMSLFAETALVLRRTYVYVHVSVWYCGLSTASPNDTVMYLDYIHTYTHMYTHANNVFHA